ncbi:hypothetical protein ACHHYP_09957 [Achlya hypogyna]|uniref:Secreted protein n=1 Tax=Achlya hypogyna TaxID=1202772 RepID=A0A1V9YM66_ACHHY|nr:hypothetical protein ACHHYP_09957 [Achlya hypogyna]
MQLLVAIVAALVALVVAFEERDVLVKNALGDFTDDFARADAAAVRHVRSEFHLVPPTGPRQPVTDAEYNRAVAIVQGLGKIPDQRAAVDSVRTVMARMHKEELLQFLSEFDDETTTKFEALAAESGRNATVLAEAPDDRDRTFESSAIGACIVVASVLVGVILVVRSHRHESDAAIIAHVLRAIQEKDPIRKRPAKSTVVVV